MDKKKKIIIYVITGIFVLVVAIIAIIGALNDKTKKPVEGEESSEIDLFEEDLTREIPRIKNLLNSSSYFKSSKIETDMENEAINIDNKYRVGIRQGYVYFDIGYDEDVTGYCNVVDAIEQGLGAKESTLDTCKNSLNGSITNEFMLVSFESDKMFVTVGTENAGKIPTETKFFNLGDEIELGSKNFGMVANGYSLTNTSSGFNVTTKSSNVCFTIFNKAKVPRDFIVRYYDSDKKQVYEEKYSYTGESNPAEHICVSWENENTVKYFSIN